MSTTTDRTRTPEERRTRYALSHLAWKASRVRGMNHDATVALVTSVTEGATTLDPAAVAQEVEVYLGTVRCHEKCKAWVREYGYAPYKSTSPSYVFPADKCEVCATPMGCKNPDGKHTYVELSQAECRAAKVYHGGNCYHVSRCTGCGDIHSVDSSG